MTNTNEVELGAIIKPANAQAVIAALDPAWSIDASGMACIVPYSFNMETLLVAHVDSVPGAGASSPSQRGRKEARQQSLFSSPTLTD